MAFKMTDRERLVLDADNKHDHVYAALDILLRAITADGKATTMFGTGNDQWVIECKKKG